MEIQAFPERFPASKSLTATRECSRGLEKVVLTDLMEFIKVRDPDVILFPYADTWVPLIVKRVDATALNLHSAVPAGSSPWPSKSYWSYGKVNHKEGALIPEGRVLIDTAKSFVYTEGGLKGVLMASQLSGLSPNLTSRFTPGTLISSYEVYEALGRGVVSTLQKTRC